MEHVIVGAGPAGVVAAERLRKLDPQADIRLLTGEPEPPYSRMAIPYYLVDQIPESGTWLRKQQDHFERQRIEVRQAMVTGLDPDQRRLSLADGQSLGFDRLLLATGSSPVIPPLPGMEREGVHTCWTLADARAILQRARQDARVVLIGAGFIGSIILEALVKRGTQLTVVEQGDRMVPRMMDAEAGDLIRRWCEQRGVSVRTSTTVTGVDDGPGDHPLAVVLDGGEQLPADLVIVSAGVRSNTAFLEGSGLEIDQGIRVDHRLCTNRAGIYAAGDVAQGPDFSTGGWSVHAVQPTSVDHGQVAASNMAGRDRRYHGSLLMNVLDTLGLISTSFGQWEGVDGGDSVALLDRERYRYLRLQFQDDLLVGANSLGLTEHVGVLRGLIEGQVRLGPWKKRLQTDPTRLMEAYLGSTQAIGRPNPRRAPA
ncbi:NAD(P)/FAD-dependent oxidoreductase [Alkalilimnicola ehrlichii MLHE-1]|uniref:FAD-dependent pyridine nucleotide-disulfide oxidoreductase n=1 Tax=Alkalilimnicola ehrlichii (strain ATCC BAA-1101 / DSM 17681 / MLHE-1) TaxID=187272 RepID=Q0A942_ALKEH|nr:FAD-dependent oxidoreductase [Alkalilimnicola ehrlichii]ABI56645.1 FAD-dependent pyridine nucleotide-disulfide oxidoreductase [Alkalilimnicola ehrlichii MLHE-1]